MSFPKKNHIILLFIFIYLILVNCQLKEPVKNHGILHLKNRSELVEINKSNKNDIVKIIGQPHSMSTFSENEWIYFERTLTKGEFLKLGQNILKTNNILILKFNKYGILQKKVFLDKSHKNKLAFSKDRTENNVSKKSFVEKFLSSLRNKMYGKK
tara:strand:- start:186 stop:650 length:465 start_codon:yes stop_codon:yes gene_type:complete